MPHIEFTSDPKLPADMKHLGFKKGDVVELTEDQCNRWIRRNCAKSVPAPLQQHQPAPRAPRFGRNRDSEPKSDDLVGGSF